MSNPAHATGEQWAIDRAFITPVPGTAYTPDLQDRLNLIQFTGASAATFTVPANASVPYKTGTILSVLQSGGGAVTIAAAAGVTINKAPGKTLTLSSQYTLAQLLKTGADEWVAYGGLSG